MCKAAYEFNIAYITTNYALPDVNAEESPANAGTSGGGAGSSEVAAPAPRPSRPGKDAGMATARAMASANLAHAAAPPPPPPLPPLPEGPLNDEQIAERLSLLHCEWADAEQTELQGTAETSADEVGLLLNKIGADYCKLLVPEREYVFQRSQHGDLNLNCHSRPVVDGDGGSGDGDEMLADEEWRSLEGGPWIAKLMRASRQPVDSATYRNFQMPLSFDPVTTPLMPGGQLKLPIVAGGPPDGIKLQLPASWTARTRSMMFRLKLSKAGATSSSVTINQILFRAQVPPTDTEEEEAEQAPEENDGGGGGGGDLLAHEPPLATAVVPLAEIPAGALAAAAPDGTPPPAASIADSQDGVDAIQAAVRASHLELNMGMPPASDGTMAARARELLTRSGQALPGEGEAAAEPPSFGDVPAQHAAQMGAAAEAVDVAQNGAPGADSEAEAAEDPEAVEAMEEEDAEAEAGSPPHAVIAQPQQRASARAHRKRVRFGDNGEFDGAASSFKSAPIARKASPRQSEEMGVPAFALPGETVFAMGLHAGTRKRFKARVERLRKMVRVRSEPNAPLRVRHAASLLSQASTLECATVSAHRGSLPRR